jgi:hypothetical protein
MEMSDRKKQKAAYDREYRKHNKERIRAKKAAYHKRTYDPVEAAKERRKRAPQHLEYCRQPNYKEWKRDYDKRRRDSKFGEFAEAYEAFKALIREIRKQMPDRFERYAQAGRKQWDAATRQRYRRKQNGLDDLNSY